MLRELLAQAVDNQFARPARESVLVLTFALLVLTVIAVLSCSWRFPRTCLALAVAGFAVVALGWPAVVGVLVAAVLTVTCWRWVHPESYRSRVRPRLRAWRARWFRYAPRWKMLCSRHGLEVRDRGEYSWLDQRRHDPYAAPRVVIERARLKRFVSTETLDRLLVGLPKGLSHDDVTKVAEPFAHATRSIGCKVRPDRPGRIWIELARRDSLAAAIAALPIPKRVDLTEVRVGTREDGGPWHVPVLATHVLVAGSTGAGKGSVMWSLLRGLAPDIASGKVEVWGFDPKGGMELALGAGLFTRVFTDGSEAMADALEECAELMHDRARTLAGVTRCHRPTDEAPLRVILIDELATLTALCERKTALRVNSALRRLLTQGRAPGCSVVAFLQDPGKDVLEYRNLFGHRIALRLGEANEVDMVLRDGAKAAGAEAHRIDPARPGVGYVCHESRPEPIRVRAAYVTDDQIRAQAAQYACPASRAALAEVRGLTAEVDLDKREPGEDAA